MLFAKYTQTGSLLIYVGGDPVCEDCGHRNETYND